jgi:hypothetical protein
LTSPNTISPVTSAHTSPRKKKKDRSNFSSIASKNYLDSSRNPINTTLETDVNITDRSNHTASIFYNPHKNEEPARDFNYLATFARH